MKSSKDGLQYICKDCNRIHRRNMYKKNREKELPKFKEYNRTKRNKEEITSSILFKKYGITIHDYNRMLEEQSFSCKICQTSHEQFKTKLAVDHCHTTGKVRGLLCTKCNLSVGYYENWLFEWIDKIKDYIKD